MSISPERLPQVTRDRFYERRRQNDWKIVNDCITITRYMRRCAHRVTKRKQY